MGRKTNQKHFQRKAYANVDAWAKENAGIEAAAGTEFYGGGGKAAANPMMKVEVAQQMIAKMEEANPYIVAYQQPEIFEGDNVNPLETVGDMYHLAEFVKRRYSENARMIQLYHSRLMDIQHEIEMLPPKNAPKGYRVYKDQRDILLRRRVAKDENAVLEPLKELIDKNPEVFNALGEVLNQIRHIDKGRELRKYAYRAPEMLPKEEA